MDKIAFITETTLIYWSPIILAIAGVAAALIYLAVYIGRGGKFTPAFTSIPIAAILGILISRFFHWYCRTGSYTSFQAAFTDFTTGDFALVGMFIGCMLTACILRVTQLSKDLPQMLDAMSVGGCVGISLGRLSSLFNETSRGMLISEDVGFPFTYDLINPVSGVSENRLATFLIQSAATALIAIGLFAYMLVQAIRKRKIKNGDIFLLFLSAYSITQIVCDSTRYDALVFRSNGFVSMVQILGAAALAFVIVIISIRLVRNRGFRFWYLAFWIGIAGFLGLAGYMEYFVQNNGVKAAFAYSMMSSALVATYVVILIMRCLANKCIPAAEIKPAEETPVDPPEETHSAPIELPKAEEPKEETSVVPTKTKLSKKQKRNQNRLQKQRKNAKRSKKYKKSSNKSKSKKQNKKKKK